ncbi:hypothetical protein KD144_010155 [Niallia circulans]|nr:hypothetical protein [Niallia circulans]MCB5237233.1 hypothetical protein [Niallia circulans]HEO8422197.1 hypothetical protein [Yersinia enterocolitica]
MLARQMGLTLDEIRAFLQKDMNLIHNEVSS